MGGNAEYIVLPSSCNSIIYYNMRQNGSLVNGSWIFSVCLFMTNRNKQWCGKIRPILYANKVNSSEPVEKREYL